MLSLSSLSSLSLSDLVSSRSSFSLDPSQAYLRRAGFWSGEGCHLFDFFLKHSIVNYGNGELLALGSHQGGMAHSEMCPSQFLIW